MSDQPNSRKRSNSSFARVYASAPGTTVICVLLCAVYLVTAAESRSLENNLSASWIADHLILYGPLAKELPFGPLRVIGMALLHAGPGHLLFNGFLIFLLGREIERAYGTSAVIGIFLAGAVGSGAALLGLDFTSATVGASGAGFALMAVMLGLVITRGADWRAPLALVVINLGYSIMMPGISLIGHVGGLLAGAVIAVAVSQAPNRKVRESSPWIVLLAAVCIVAVEVVV